MNVPEIEMRIIGVRPVTLCEPDPSIYDPNDEKRTLIEAEFYLEKEGKRIMISLPIIDYSLTKSTMFKYYFNRRVRLRIKWVVGLDNRDKDIKKLDIENKLIHQTKGQYYIEGEVIKIEERDFLDHRGEKVHAYDTIIDCGLPIYTCFREPIHVGEYYHLKGFPLSRSAELLD